MQYNYKSLWLIAAIAFFAIFVLNLPFPLIVLTAGLTGYFTSKKYPELFSSNAGHKKSQKDYGIALIDDDTLTPDHAKFRGLHLIKILIIAALLWFIPVLGLDR